MISPESSHRESPDDRRTRKTVKPSQAVKPKPQACLPAATILSASSAWRGT